MRQPLLRPRALAIVALVVASVALPATADAQRRKKRRAKPAATAPRAPADQTGKTPANKNGGKEQVFDFTGLQLQGSMRTPQLLYFLERASQELDRASLERRSFVPEMLRSIEEERL